MIISALAAGTFFIPTKDKHERRLKFFKKVTQRLKKSKLSVIASSEGVHDHFHGIAPFNKGIYHMAIEANLPVVALFIYIPKESNITRGNSNASGGDLKIDFLKEFNTNDWSLDTLNEHIEEVRNTFVNRFNQLNPNERTT
jgi:putative phosphoserine phosphatase/1-acylglycerol-3-phosphate O-acyltransferase